MEKAKMNARASLKKIGKYHTLKIVIHTGDEKDIDILVKPLCKNKTSLAKLYYLLGKKLPTE